ncbi:MAG: Eco57I restriction-modification methylase domain-containing protein [Myxococcota bacterium]|nr:Eco57I restriction-modification methylase domain-containing protein [Myxococcota bacterium]
MSRLPIVPAVDAVATLSAEYREQTDDEHKKAWGQFFTSQTIATFMASLLRAPSRREVRVLDAGAGTGVLGIAVAEALITTHGSRVHLVAVEKEAGALAALREAVSAAYARLGSASLHVEVIAGDFLDLDRPQLGSAPLASFDYAIANPPYFKMSPNDDRGGDAPNIYARFMEVSARMLREDGDLCFIIPRSFAAGYYFRPFRRRFSAAMRLDHVHLFDSRRDAFRDDGVLQENIIVLYSRSRKDKATVRISCSTGERDLGERFVHDVARARVLSTSDPNAVLYLPANARDLRVMETFASWHDSLASYGLDVSTGPVVPFRAEEFLRTEPSKTTAPMLWLQHVLPGRVEWPLAAGFRKPEHIERAAPEKLLVKNRTYVLLRRFSAKEDARRLVSAPYLRDSIRAPLLGLENHVNFIHRKRGELATTEAQALSALLNSALFDAYFRISNGNTQVSATELRALPLPPASVLEAVVAHLAQGATQDAAVTEVLGEI